MSTGEIGGYGIVRRGGEPASEALAALQESIQVRGFGVVPAVLTPDEVGDLAAAMDEIYARQCAEAGGEAELALMNDADIVRCMLAYDDRYLALALHPQMIAVGKAVLGENFVLLMQNGVVNRPDRAQFQTNWHRDLNYQHWVCSRPISMSVLVCLEDFTPETGGTVFLPGSHLLEDFPSPAIVTASEATPVAEAGSMIFFNSMTFHRAGVNRSRRVRRAVNHVLGAPILAQQVDIPAMLRRPAPADAWAAGYLGYRWNAPADVAGWRRRRIAEARARQARADAS